MAGGAVLGAGVVASGGLLALWAVPAAMATFGTIVAGTGTIHAATAAGGVAATLQAYAAAALTTSAIAKGAAVGAGAAAAGSLGKPLKRTLDGYSTALSELRVP